MAVPELSLGNYLVGQFSRIPRFVKEKFQKNSGRFKGDFF